MHQRLDLSAEEDRSPMRSHDVCWALCMFRRIGISLFMHWHKYQPKRVKVTLPDFYEKMSLENQRRASALVNFKQSAALENS